MNVELNLLFFSIINLNSKTAEILFYKKSKNYHLVVI